MTVGLTVGFDNVDVNPVGEEVQLKVLVTPPRVRSPRVVFAPRQMALLSPAMADGNGFTVTTTLFDLLHPPVVMVSVTV